MQLMKALEKHIQLRGFGIDIAPGHRELKRLPVVAHIDGEAKSPALARQAVLLEHPLALPPKVARGRGEVRNALDCRGQHSAAGEVAGHGLGFAPRGELLQHHDEARLGGAHLEALPGVLRLGDVGRGGAGVTA